MAQHLSGFRGHGLPARQNSPVERFYQFMTSTDGDRGRILCRFWDGANVLSPSQLRRII